MKKSKSENELEEMRKKYHNYCPKSKSNNIISCPKDIIKKTNNQKVKWLNEYFNKIAKKSKKKKTKRSKETRPCTTVRNSECQLLEGSGWWDTEK